MSKLLTLRARTRGWSERKRVKPTDYENAPKIEAMGRHYRSRWPSEYFAPLRRFLLGCEGRHWAKVHSEICEGLRFDKAVHLHVLQHLDHFVVEKGAWRGNHYCDREGRVVWRSRWSVVYVDDEGRLRPLPRAPKRRMHERGS